MSYFAWGDDMSVGNSFLDRDHQQLIGLVNELHSATSCGKGREVVGNILARLIRYTEEHFKREEHHMECLHYSYTLEHKNQHRELLEKVLDMQFRFERGEITVAAQVSSLLRDWLSIHIRRVDKQFALEINKSNKGKNRSGPPHIT